MHLGPLLSSLGAQLVAVVAQMTFHCYLGPFCVLVVHICSLCGVLKKSILRGVAGVARAMVMEMVIMVVCHGNGGCTSIPLFLNKNQDSQEKEKTYLELEMQMQLEPPLPALSSPFVGIVISIISNNQLNEGQSNKRNFQKDSFFYKKTTTYCHLLWLLCHCGCCGCYVYTGAVVVVMEVVVKG